MSAPAPVGAEGQDQLWAACAQMAGQGVDRVVISKPARRDEPYRKLVLERRDGYYQLSRYTQTQVFHGQVPLDQLGQACFDLAQGRYLQLNGWGEGVEHILLLSRKGRCTYRRKRVEGQAPGGEVREGHNREKRYLLEEGVAAAPLVDMGILTKEGRVVRAKYDKFRQINRFLELLDDAVGALDAKRLNVIDFGCGKSYLTFVVYDYLTRLRGIQANVVGLDLKADVIEKCRQAAARYGYTGLRFELGDINGYRAPFEVDLVLTLHACDTATDYALFNAVNWKAKLIFSVPCCQHELNGQIHTDQLEILTRYGIVKERFSALATDAIRANLLEYCGYKTQLLEFIDLAHTPKNLLIRAVRRPMIPKGIREKALAEAQALMEQFSFQPTMYTLLGLSQG